MSGVEVHAKSVVGLYRVQFELSSQLPKVVPSVRSEANQQLSHDEGVELSVRVVPDLTLAHIPFVI